MNNRAYGQSVILRKRPASPVRRGGLLCVGLFLVLAGALQAGPRYVATNGINGGTYESWATAASNIQWAVDAAQAGETVWISNGVYVLTNYISVISNLAIYGTGGVVTVDGNNSNRCFSFSATATGVLANLFITRGYADKGGGLYMRSGTVRDCIFSNNTAYSTSDGGGGAFFDTGTNLIQSCTFVDNTSSSTGGGVYVRSTSKSIIAGCTFRTNSADRGGGLAVDTPNGTLITNCDFIANVATNRGGGANILGGSGNYMTHCTFDGNVSLKSDGGGMFTQYYLVCSNSFFSNNIATNSGGGMYASYATVKNCTFARNATLRKSQENTGGGGIASSGISTIEDCVIEENRSGYWGGGVYHMGTTIRNCLIRNNVANNGSGSGDGGGILVFSQPGANISSCTIVSNYAQNRGGGIYNNNQLYYDTIVENCIIYSNQCTVTPSASDLYDNTASPHYSSYSNCCFAGEVYVHPEQIIVTNLVTTYPQFVDFTGGNYRLNKDSPCINTGAYRDWMTGAGDLDGNRRLDRFSGLPDIGCFEYLSQGTLLIIR